MSEPTFEAPALGSPIGLGDARRVEDPDICPHLRIDNETARCVECNDEMVAWTLDAQTVLSAPNLTPCTNPEHLAAIARGESVECDATYTPGTAVPVLIGYDPRYECRRCASSGEQSSIVEGEPMVVDCGRSHRGTIIRAKE